MEKFPSHDFHLIVGKFTEDTGDTGASPPPPPQLLQDPAHLREISVLYEIYTWLAKNGQMFKRCDSVEVGAAPFQTVRQRI